MGWLRRRRRAHLRAAPFPEPLRRILLDRVPRYPALSAEQREALEDDVAVFLAEKQFVGCAGVEITDEVRVVIAAEACVLLLGRDADEVFPNVRTVLVYPTAWMARAVTPMGGGMSMSAPVARLGEAWRDGEIILAWDAVEGGIHDRHDGDDVVLHEFAHALDHEDGSGDGAPTMPYGRTAAWATVLGSAWDGLQADVADEVPDVLRAYGATSPAEFFAVATETFFERGERLRAEHPALYAQLVAFYGQDPAPPAPRTDGPRAPGSA